MINRGVNRKILVLIICLLIFTIRANCQNIQSKTSPLKGIWIEQEKKCDTIIFADSYEGQNATFELRRGFRITEDGYKLPDYFSGPYNYRLDRENIWVYWFLSSGSFQSYYFKMLQGGTRFKIGNFFKDPEKRKMESDTLIFVRKE